MHMPSSRASTTSRSQQPEGEPSSEQFDLPTSITLAPTTDAMQAAGLINLSLSQPGASSFLLHIPQQPAQGKGGKPGRSLLSVALSVVLATRKVRVGACVMPSFSRLGVQGIGVRGGVQLHEKWLSGSTEPANRNLCAQNQRGALMHHQS